MIFAECILSAVEERKPYTLSYRIHNWQGFTWLSLLYYYNHDNSCFKNMHLLWICLICHHQHHLIDMTTCTKHLY